MTDPRKVDALRPLLQQAEERLEGQLTEVCAYEDVARENTRELIRLEESLTLAAEAAKATISLRRRLKALEPDDEILPPQ